MNRNTLSRQFNGMIVFIILLPLIAGIFTFVLNRGVLGISGLLVPGVIYAAFVGCTVFLAYLFSRNEKDYAAQLEKVRKEGGRHIAELNALREISELKKEPMQAEDLLKLILDKAMQVIAVRNGSIFLVDSSEPEGLRLVAANPPVVLKDETGARPRRLSFVKTVIESGKVLRIQDIEHDPRTMQANNPKYGSPSFISMPVYKNKQIVAVMNLANKESGSIFTESDERILSIMLAEIGVGIENISLANQVRLQQAQIRDLQSKLKM